MSEILSTFVYHAVPTRFFESCITLHAIYVCFPESFIIYVLFYLEKMFNLTSHGTRFEMLSRPDKEVS